MAVALEHFQIRSIAAKWALVATNPKEPLVCFRWFMFISVCVLKDSFLIGVLLKAVVYRDICIVCIWNTTACRLETTYTSAQS